MATKPGKFDPDKLEKLNLSALFEQHEPNWMDSADHLMALRQWHRQLSEEMVATYRELARLAVRNGGDSPEAQALRAQAQELQAKRAEAEADIEAAVKQYQALLEGRQQKEDRLQPLTGDREKDHHHQRPAVVIAAL